MTVVLDFADMEEYPDPPLVDPLTEAANAHLAALAKAEQAEKNKAEEEAAQQSPEDTGPRQPSTPASSSSASLDELPVNLANLPAKPDSDDAAAVASIAAKGNTVSVSGRSSVSVKNANESPDRNKLSVPMPLVEESKEPGISYFLTVPPVTLLGDREPPPKILKEPRGLYAVQRDQNPFQCIPRWPSECQVLPQRIKHIRSVPSVAEVFYEPTGKEPCPRPLGEDHGIVVFDYMPTSPVNYFSRSVLGPTPNGQPDPAAAPFQPMPDPPLPDCLKFESRFESGNIAKVIRITEAYYEIHLRPDYYTSKHCQWFYFQVQNMRSDLTYRFSIVNFSKPDSLYNYGMKPVLYSEIEAERHYVGWSRVGSNIRYYRNENMFDEEEGYSFTLTFTLNFPHDNDTVYIAHCYPYTYSDLQEDLAAIQNNEARARYCSQRLLCRTLAGNNVYILTITAPASQEDLKRKSVVVLSARVHPGETPSSWIMRGILDFLTGESNVAADLRERFIFKVVPMLNPDGVIVGNTRCSLAGRDLNRQYKSVIKEAFPSVFNVKTLVRRLMEESGVVFYCDLHAHSRKFNVFIYGCENRRHSEKYLREQVFPLMLHKNTAEKFSFEDCRFKIQRQKESTGRVVFWNMGITYSYTLEASYGGTNMGSRAFTHFNTEDYEGIGRYFCETMLDFQDPCPVQEQLRNKIVSRLIKEGSNADDPSNIALSDYSSLSSGGESSLSDAEESAKNSKQQPAANANANANAANVSFIANANTSEDTANANNANIADDEEADNEEAEAQAAAEERRRVRRLRSRRDRSKNAGAHFSQNMYPDFRQVVDRYGSEMRKVGSDKSISKNGTSKATPSRTPKGKSNNNNPGSGPGSSNPAGQANDNHNNSNANSSSTGSKKGKKKFKRSLTMTSLPLSFFKGCASGNSGSAKDLQSRSSHNTPTVQEKSFTNNNSERNVTKFTIGTSDEDDDNDDDTSKDLEKLFCPLTDSNGAPYEIVDNDGNHQHSLNNPHVGPTGGEALSASSCRRVQSEILASVSRIKSSILGRKGGFLHSYNLLESHSNNSLASMTSNSTLTVSNVKDHHVPVVGGVGAEATPIKITPPTPTRGKIRTSKSHGSLKRAKSPAAPTLANPTSNPNAITVSLPSPAGNRKSQSVSTDTPNKGGGGSGKGSNNTGNSKDHNKGSSLKNKASKIRKAIKGDQQPPPQRGRIGSNSSIKHHSEAGSGSETPPMKHGKGKSSKKKKKSLRSAHLTNSSNGRKNNEK